MARPATGNIMEDRRTKDTVYGLRFRVNGQRQYQRLGSRSEGWTRAKAEEARKDIQAEVRLGTWQPPAPATASAIEEPREVPTFWAFAREWFARRCDEGGRRGKGLTERGRMDLKWRLNVHLRPAFGLKRLDQITVEDVDAFRLVKVREGKLAPTSINKLISTLMTILEEAIEYGLIDGRNPAKGRRRRLAAEAPERLWIGRADHIEALLDGARQADEVGLAPNGRRRAVLATLCFAGLRLSEALALRWADVDLARGTITVRASKTVTGMRVVDVLPVLRDELLDYKDKRNSSPERLLFASTKNNAANRTHQDADAKLLHMQDANNVRRQMQEAIEYADKRLVKAKTQPLPEGLTPQSLRRTFASILFALGESPVYVAAQLGHTTPAMTLGFYAKVMDRRDGEPERLKALVKGEIGQEFGKPMGSKADSEAGEPLVSPENTGL
jgi:integrase